MVQHDPVPEFSLDYGICAAKNGFILHDFVSGTVMVFKNVDEIREYIHLSELNRGHQQ